MTIIIRDKVDAWKNRYRAFYFGEFQVASVRHAKTYERKQVGLRSIPNETGGYYAAKFDLPGFGVLGSGAFHGVRRPDDTGDRDQVEAFVRECLETWLIKTGLSFNDPAG